MAKFLGVVCLLVCTVFFSTYVVADIPTDEITSLPGVNFTIGFQQYAGYIPVTYQDIQLEFFYWFVTSQNDPTTDPIVLWLNGGPGCSSLLGFLTENGPFYLISDSELGQNPYSWNRIANMLYLESPPGVGFSKQLEHILYDDNITAQINFQFLQNWFSSYSEFMSNDFFITGESYAGHYIPTLANEIYLNNNQGVPPFKGFMVGNPSTTSEDDGASLTEYFQTHGLLQLNDNTDYPSFYLINPYDILVDVCAGPMLKEYVRFPNHMNVAQNPHLNRPGPLYVANPDPCVQDYETYYLNLPEVQEAIHADLNTNWTACGGFNPNNYTFGSESIVPYYQSFIKNTDWTIEVYSGDEDTVINFIGTEEWIIALGLKIKKPWSAWNYKRIDGTGTQLAGFTIEYDGITYTTVKGAGHMVPYFQPAPAFQLFTNYLTKAAARK